MTKQHFIIELQKGNDLPYRAVCSPTSSHALMEMTRSIPQLKLEVGDQIYIEDCPPAVGKVSISDTGALNRHKEDSNNNYGRVMRAVFEPIE
jgi:hypothetical protein